MKNLESPSLLLVSKLSRVHWYGYMHTWKWRALAGWLTGM
jgi:hypothetical protein